jgi:hypothetical protein
MPSNTTLKGNRNLRNSKKSSRKSSRRSQDEDNQYENKYNVPQQQMAQQNYMNDLQNPYNLEFDPLHVNYITPSFKNLNLNNYGVSADQLSMGPQVNSMYNASMKDFSMMPPQMAQQMPQQQMMQQMPQQQMIAPMQQQMEQPMMSMGQQPLEQMNQSGGSKFMYKRFLKKL